MSSETVEERAKQTMKAFKEAIDKVEDSAHKALDKAAPTLQKSFDASMDAAAKGFVATMKSIDRATTGDQVKLLRAYQKFLGGQVEFVNARITDLEQKARSKKREPVV